MTQGRVPRGTRIRAARIERLQTAGLVILNVALLAAIVWIVYSALTTIDRRNHEGTISTFSAAPALVYRPSIVAEYRSTPRPVEVKVAWSTAMASRYGSPGDSPTQGLAAPGAGNLSTSRRICASKTLPFGTKLAIRYRDSEETFVVLDRGPYVAGRELDLSYGGAKGLGFDGLGEVSYRVVGKLPESEWRRWQ